MTFLKAYIVNVNVLRSHYGRHKVIMMITIKDHDTRYMGPTNTRSWRPLLIIPNKLKGRPYPTCVITKMMVDHHSTHTYSSFYAIIDTHDCHASCEKLWLDLEELSTNQV